MNAALPSGFYFEIERKLIVFGHFLKSRSMLFLSHERAQTLLRNNTRWKQSEEENNVDSRRHTAALATGLSRMSASQVTPSGYLQQPLSRPAPRISPPFSRTFPNAKVRERSPLASQSAQYLLSTSLSSLDKMAWCCSFSFWAFSLSERVVMSPNFRRLFLPVRDRLKPPRAQLRFDPLERNRAVPTVSMQPANKVARIQAASFLMRSRVSEYLRQQFGCGANPPWNTNRVIRGEKTKEFSKWILSCCFFYHNDESDWKKKCQKVIRVLALFYILTVIVVDIIYHNNVMRNINWF